MYYFYDYIDIKLEFESRSYTVDDKNNPETPVIRITYPVIVPPHLFPIHIKVEAEDDTASGKLLHTNFVKCLITQQYLLWSYYLHHYLHT